MIANNHLLHARKTTIAMVMSMINCIIHTGWLSSIGVGILSLVDTKILEAPEEEAHWDPKEEA